MNILTFGVTILGAATREDWQAVANELIAEAREVNGEARSDGNYRGDVDSDPSGEPLVALRCRRAESSGPMSFFARSR